MNITVDKKDNGVATLNVEVPADKVSQERSKIIKSFIKQAKVPGFRPGKAPEKIIEKKFSQEIKQELESHLLNEACAKAIEEEKLKALNVRVPEAPTFGEDGTFTFKTDVTLAPEFDLPDYKGIEVTVNSEEVTDEDIQISLEDLQQRFAEFKDTEEALVDGQLAVVDFTSNIDGKSIEEAVGKSAGYLDGREGHWVKIDEDSFLPGFADELKGAKVGDEKTFSLTINEEFPITDLRGKDVEFNVTVKETKEQELPELNDEFAAKLIPEKGMDELKDVLTEQLAGEKKRTIADDKVQQIVKYLGSKVDFNIPEEMLESEKQATAQSMVQRGIQQGMTEDQIKDQEEEITKAAEEQAATTLKTNFILQEIAQAEEIQAADQDVIQRISAMAQQANKPVKKYLAEIRKNNQLDSIRNSVLVGKTIDFLVESANITVKSDTENA